MLDFESQENSITRVFFYVLVVLTNTWVCGINPQGMKSAVRIF